MSMGICMWVAMGPGGDHRQLVQHAKDKRMLVILAWFAPQVGEMVLELCRRLRRETANKQDLYEVHYLMLFMRMSDLFIVFLEIAGHWSLKGADVLVITNKVG